jgi:hypothetical protein
VRVSRVAALVVVSSAFLARSARPSEADERPVFDAAIAATDTEATALVAAVEEVAARLGLRVRVEHRDAPPADASWPDDVIAGVWIDARAPDRIDVRTTSVRAGSPARSFARSLARAGSPDVVVDEVAEIVRAALESVRASRLDPADVDPGRRTAPAPEPPPTASTPSLSHEGPHGFGLDLIAFGSERAMSARSTPVLGAGAALEASFGRAPWRPSLWLSAAYGSRFDTEGGAVTFDAGASSLRLMPGVGLLDLDAMQLDLDVGGGVDFFGVSPLIVRGTQAMVGPTTRYADPVVTGQLLMRLRLVSQVRLTFGFDVDDAFATATTHPTSVGIGRGTGPRDTFVPWTVRPAVAVGLCVPLSNGGACTNTR